MNVEATTPSTNEWIKARIKEDEITKYMEGDDDFINDEEIETLIREGKDPDPAYVRDIMQKSLAIETLSPKETAALINVTDPDLLAEMKETAFAVKKKVYDNRIVTFAPLYMANYCVNNCLYCGFRSPNNEMKRTLLSMDEVRKEIEVLAGKIGHKRLIVVYGEHPKSGLDYMLDTIRTIYDVTVPTRTGRSGEIRRVNVNAAPLQIDELKQLKTAGLGTFQVFQETYHHETYRKVHPENTIKGNYRWRLYCMHRAQEAGIDDVGLGALFGLYDWRFEVMGLLYHTRELEKVFGIGGHTISFPRLEPAHNSPYSENAEYRVSDEDFLRIITILRLAVPYTGMIVTARETPQTRREAIRIGCTQTDASTRIGVGAYSEAYNDQVEDRQQFMLGDTRTLDEVIREFADDGYITSFCTAGYRCGRTGEKIMTLLRSGMEGRFCKLNGVLTFREWLDDFASEETKKAGERVIQQEIGEVKERIPEFYPTMMDYYKRISEGECDLYL